MQLRGIEDNEKISFFTKLNAINPVTKEKIPVFFTNYVLMGFGTGAVFGCPAHDQRDFEFAKKNSLKILKVIEPPFKNKTELPYIQIEKEAKLVNSDFLNNLNPIKLKKNN